MRGSVFFFFFFFCISPEYPPSASKKTSRSPSFFFFITTFFPSTVNVVSLSRTGIACLSADRRHERTERVWVGRGSSSSSSSSLPPIPRNCYVPISPTKHVHRLPGADCSCLLSTFADTHVRRAGYTWKEHCSRESRRRTVTCRSQQPPRRSPLQMSVST